MLRPDQLWNDDPPAKALVSLQACVTRLRRVLEPNRDARAPARVLVTRPPGYALVVDRGDVDARRFGEQVSTARPLLAEAPARAEELLTAALGLWRGEAYGDVADDCGALATEAARLEELRVSAVEGLCTARLALGRAGEVVPELEQIVADHPMRESAWAQPALALYRCGRQADALDAVRRTRHRLADELGLDPGPQLRRRRNRVS